MKKVTRPEEHAPVKLELTEAQKKQLVEYMKQTGHQVALNLQIEVVEGKIAPAAVSVGAA